MNDSDIWRARVTLEKMQSEMKQKAIDAVENNVGVNATMLRLAYLDKAESLSLALEALGAMPKTQ